MYTTVSARKLPKTAGFTLLEILTVVVIIGILLVLIVPNVVARADEARVTAAKSDLRGIASALDMYRLDNSHYPSSSQGLRALVRRPSGTPEPRNWGPESYLKKMPEDPWDQEYAYLKTGNGFEIISLGADGEEGGDGFATDIKHSNL